MSYKIFTLSPGSTSTKLAVFQDTELLFKSNVQHDPVKWYHGGTILISGLPMYSTIRKN